MEAPDLDRDEEAKAAADAALWRRFSGTAGDNVKADKLHRKDLIDAQNHAFSLYLNPIASPDTLRAEALMPGRWRIGHERLQLDNGAPPWSVKAPSHHYADRLHRFDWLEDMFSQGEASAFSPLR